MTNGVLVTKARRRELRDATVAFREERPETGDRLNAAVEKAVADPRIGPRGVDVTVRKAQREILRGRVC